MKLTKSKLQQIIKEEIGREKDFQKLSSMGLEQDEISLVMSALEGDERAQNEFYDSQALDKLTDWYKDEMPYGVMTGDEGVPDEWVLDKLNKELGEGFDAEAAVEELESNVMPIANEEARNNLLNAATKEEFDELVDGMRDREKDY